MAKAAQNKAGDVRAKTPDEIGTLLLDLRKEQFNLRFQRATGQQEGAGRMREVRREIARAKTILTEKQRSSVVAKRAKTNLTETQRGSVVAK
jgi:large subunit ribosomal protein L29